MGRVMTCEGMTKLCMKMGVNSTRQNVHGFYITRMEYDGMDIYSIETYKAEQQVCVVGGDCDKAIYACQNNYERSARYGNKQRIYT